LLTSLTDTPLLNTMHNISRRDKGQLKAKKLKTVFIQHMVNKITLTFKLLSLLDLAENLQWKDPRRFHSAHRCCYTAVWNISFQ